MSMVTRALFAGLVLSLPGPAGAQEDWPQFRGPTGQGNADVKGIPTEWGESKNIAWKAPLEGKGWSSPVILGEQIWLTTATQEGNSLRALCLHRDTGKLLHDVEVFGPSHPVRINAANSHASPTPVIEPGRVYIHFGSMGTACLSTDDAKVLWRNQSLVVDHKEGPGSSPILYQNLLIVHCDGMDLQYVVALDKATGKPIWRTDRTGKLNPDPDQRKAYSTPLVIQVGGKDQLVSPTADRVITYDPTSGKELWRVEYSGYSNVPRPVFANGLVYISTGYNKASLLAIRPEGTGDVTDSMVAWKHPDQTPAISSPIVVGHELYMVSDGGVLSCLDSATGKLLARQRLGGKFWASPSYADGRLYLFNADGEGFVLKPGASANKVTVLATNKLDGVVMATPAFSDGAMFVRTHDHLYRIEDAQASANAAAR